MATNKKRKLHEPPVAKNISAFAARKQLQATHDFHEYGPKASIKRDEKPTDSAEEQDFENGSILSSGAAAPKLVGRVCQEFRDGDDDYRANIGNLSDSHDGDSDLREITSKESREAGRPYHSEHSWTHLTTVSLSKGNARRLGDGSLMIRIAPGERLVLLGEYKFSVLRGQITILGAILSNSEKIYAVCASSSHSLPVMRFFSSDVEKAEICLHQSKSGLRSLRQLSPLFAGIWSNSSGHLEGSDSPTSNSWRLKSSSFRIIMSRDENSRAGYYPIVSPPEWNELLSISALERSKNGKASVTMICGPKSSGKSTFSRLMTNRLLTTFATQRTDSSIAFLDLDPGQPEYSPPGQMSLLLLSNPNFGAPYSHPDGSTSGSRLIRAHSITAVSPSSDPAFYLACAADLFSCYVNMLLPTHCPLIINTPGWILGTGLELLVNLIKTLRPTQVIYMSQDGPREVVESLQDAIKSVPVSTLPSQPTEYLHRTSAQLRTMQYMSYFHLDPLSSEDHVWNSDPITSLAPLEVRYAGKAAGILGIMCLYEQPSTRMLRDTIDGSLVAVVVIEDIPALLSSKSNEQLRRNLQDQSGEDTSMKLGENDAEVFKPQFSEQSFRRLEETVMLETPEGIPYFNPATCAPLDPSYSHTIGLALIRGIDVKRQMFQLLTPITANSIRNIRASGKAVILVSGKLDTPGWAYLEALYRENADMKEAFKRGGSDEGIQDSGDEEAEDEVADGQVNHGDGFGGAPWIEMLQGDKGRDVGARVWRVRRDLGRTGEGP